MEKTKVQYPHHLPRHAFSTTTEWQHDHPLTSEDRATGKPKKNPVMQADHVILGKFLLSIFSSEK